MDFGQRQKTFLRKIWLRESVLLTNTGKKVYVTANITAHDRDLEGVQKYFEELKEIGPDALIISDPGVFQIATEICPEIDIHISTQANNVNYRTFRFWHKLGATRVVTARELSIREIADIDAHIPEDLEIETFVHGAMCISYSGRCLLSNILPAVMRILVHVPIRAAGNIILWKKIVRENICRLRKTRGEHIFSIPRICV